MEQEDRVGPRAGVGGFWNHWPIFSRAGGNCPPPLYLGVGGGVFNATRIFSPPMYFSFSLRLFRLKLLRIAYVKDLL